MDNNDTSDTSDTSDIYDIYDTSEILVIDPSEYKYRILSIDVGVINFGISFSLLNEDYTLHKVEWVDLIDITRYTHKKCKSEDCRLYHTKTFNDWIEHLIQENYEYFECCDMIIIEKQPPQGFVVVEQLIFSKYRNKTVLINPKSVHKYFNIGDLDYDKRKELSIKIGDKYLSDDLIEKAKSLPRRHDIADSICMLIYFIKKKQLEYKKKKSYEMLVKDLKGMNIIEKLESFRYNKYKNI